MTLLPQRSIYNPLRSRRERDLYMCFLERSVICHEMSSRPEKYWAGRHDTSMTDLKNMTLLTAKQSQTSRPDMNRVQTLGFAFDGEVSWIREVSCFPSCFISGDRSLQWLQRRPWWKQKKSTNRLANHLQKMLISLLIFRVLILRKLWSEPISLSSDPATELFCSGASWVLP